jgi:hypothetical protein
MEYEKQALFLNEEYPWYISGRGKDTVSQPKTNNNVRMF